MKTSGDIARLEAPNFLNTLDILSQILVIIGALNWGFIGLGNYNLVPEFFSAILTPRTVYTIVGVGGVFQILKFLKFLVDVSPRRDVQTV